MTDEHGPAPDPAEERVPAPMHEPLHRQEPGEPDRPEPAPWDTEPRRRRSLLSHWDRRDSAKAAVLLLAAVAFVVPAYALVQKRGAETAVAAAEAAGYTAAPISAASTPASHTGPVISIVGDESVVRAAGGVPTDKRWPALVGKALDSDVETIADPDGGYATPDADGITFVQAAGNVRADADFVLIVGGTNDAAVSNLAVTKGVTNAAAAAAGRAPSASIAIIGPVITDGLTERLFTLRATLATAARVANVRFVDPVAAGWLAKAPESPAGLTAADEKRIAEHVETLVKQTPK